MKIFVIILTFNPRQYLPSLLDSLEKTIILRDFEVEFVFVDNASQDGTRNMLRQAQSDNGYTVLLNEENLGFAKGNNIGMKYALKSGADYVVLLNDDTVVTPDWIQESLKIFNTKPSAGAVQSLLLHWDKQDTVNSWGNYIHFLGFGYAGGNLEKITTLRHSELVSGSSDTSEQITSQVQDDSIQEITYASGAAVMYSAKALKDTELFDETLITYHEDLDLALRMRLHGYSSYTAFNSVVYHRYQFLKASKNIEGQYKYYLMERNRLYTILKYYSLKILLLIFPAWLLTEAGLLGFAFIRGFWKEKIRGYIWIIQNLDTILKKRREIQDIKNNNKISDKVLMHDFVAEISYQEINNPLLQHIGNPILRRYWAFVRKLI